jgi:hypothetical protein
MLAANIGFIRTETLGESEGLIGQKFGEDFGI